MPSLSLLPPSLEAPRSTVGPQVFRYRDPAADGSGAALPSWWEGVDTPLVYATIGDNGDPSDWSALPPNVHVERWVPQDVFPHAAAMVCHGGTGTVLGALTAGVPLVVVPQFVDHPDNAERVAAVGAGLRVGVDGTTTPVDPVAIRAAVTRVLSESSFRLAASRIAEERPGLPAHSKLRCRRWMTGLLRLSKVPEGLSPTLVHGETLFALMQQCCLRRWVWMSRPWFTSGSQASLHPSARVGPPAATLVAGATMRDICMT